MVWPTMSGMIVERRDQVLITRFSLRLLRSSTFLSRCSSTNGPFFRLRGMSLPLFSWPASPPRPARTAATDDELLARLVLVAGAPLGLAPRRDRMAPTGRLALAATEGMVDGVHGHATRLRAHALPTVSARLPQRRELGLRVADLTDGRAAVDRHPAHLGARQPQRGEVALLGDELDARPRAAGHLAPRARLELDVVDRRSHGDVAQRQRVAGPDLRAL